MTEQWLPVVGYEGVYSVSNLGQVLSVAKNHILKAGMSKEGYLRYSLSKNGITTSTYAHRIVAKAFLPIVDGLNWVNHLNFDKTDNRVENLEWCNSSTNQIHARDNGHYENIARGEKHYNRKKTHCKHGHEFTDENTYMHNSIRYCRTCTRATNRRWETRSHQAIDDTKRNLGEV